MRLPHLLLLVFLALVPALAVAQDAETSMFWRVVTLQDYNTRVVVIGTGLLGMASGVVGTFLLLRKRSLLSDVISHASLPGIPIAFLILASNGGTGKNFLALIAGAAISGTLGMLTVLAIRRYTRLKDDAALGIVLSSFFAFGISLVSIASRSQRGEAAGLETFIYGKTASMLLMDAKLMGGIAVVAVLLCTVLFKEFKLLCFDQNFAATQGWPVLLLDVLLMTLVVIVTVSGLQAVGLILVVAMIVIPPAAAQFWTHKLSVLTILSGLFGALSGTFGSAISGLYRDLPAGAIIVLFAAAIFVTSLIFGNQRGLMVRLLTHYKLTRKVERQHLLRALYEMAEAAGHAEQPSLSSQRFDTLLRERSWKPQRLRRIIRRLKRQKFIRETSKDNYALTAEGSLRALRNVRNHRLWEIYLINYADTAASVVDRGADHIEHVLDDEMIRRLEQLALESGSDVKLPPSPHALKHGGAAIT